MEGKKIIEGVVKVVQVIDDDDEFERFRYQIQEVEVLCVGFGEEVKMKRF